MDSTLKINFKSKGFLLTTILTLISYTYTQKCRSYTCSKLSEDLCLQLNYTSEIDNVFAQSCSDPKKSCPSYKLSSSSEVKCEDKLSLPIKQYPGGACKTKDDCINNFECKENKCLGKAENEKCERHDECLYGLACYKNSTEASSNTCNKLRALNAEGCSSEFECQMTQGCFNGKCTDYFSLTDGANLGSNKYDNSHSFCASGHDRHGICDSMKNINADQVISDELVKCDELNPCRYTSINGTITENDVCKCGKSSDSSRYCPIYGGNKFYRAAIKQIKEIISANRNECNTVERDGICNSNKLNSANDATIITYDTLKTKLNSFHEFSNSDDCIKKIFYPFYNKDYDKQPVDPVDPTGNKCPIFRCNSENNSEKKICAKNLFNDKDNKTYVDLFRKSCDWDSQFCNFDRTYFGLDTKESLCKVKDSKKSFDRYPGESCEKDQECYLLNGTPVEGLGKCNNNKCSGFDRGVNCTHTSQCLPGLYCKNNENTTTCQYQESEKTSCDSMYDCKNNLVCYNKLCQNIFYSINAGDTFTTKNFTDSEKPMAANYLCKFGLAKPVNEESSVCLMKKQIDQVDSKQGNLVSCMPEQMCNYTLTDNKNITDNFNLPCECGYNSKGQGYCKAGHNINTDSWEQINTEKRKRLNNQCHSMRRFECDQSPDSDTINSLTKKTNDLHLFYGAESCALQVLSSVSIRVSGLIPSLILAFLF